MHFCLSLNPLLVPQDSVQGTEDLGGTGDMNGHLYTHTHIHKQAHNRYTTVNIQMHRTPKQERHARQISLPDLIRNVSKMDFYQLKTYHIFAPKMNAFSEKLLKNESSFIREFDTLPPRK